MDAKTLESLILDALPDAQVRVEDLRGDGGRYSAHVSAPGFEGKTRLEQHRMVYAALKGKAEGALEALTLQTNIPQTKARR